jgi:hypothetical protein
LVRAGRFNLHVEETTPEGLRVHKFDAGHIFHWDEIDWAKTLLRSGFAILVQNGSPTDKLRKWAYNNGWRFHKRLTHAYGWTAIAWIEEHLKEENAQFDARSLSGVQRIRETVQELDDSKDFWDRYHIGTQLVRGK